MAKKNNIFFCSECGTETNGWMGKCPGCGAWNTLTEAPSETKTTTKADSSSPSLSYSKYAWTDSSKVIPLSKAGTEDYTRVSTGLSSLDELLGGGLTSGSVVLVGGEPGIGKSTLLLQLASSYKSSGQILYVSGEESPAQIGMRADRLEINKSGILVCAQTKFETIASELASIKPSLCIIDSIQTLYSEAVSGAPGSVSQAREVTAGLVRFAKSTSVPIILVGHITKEGSIAGPKTLEHMVDTVLYFEGDSNGEFRILRSVKNRFGKSNEIAFFEMTGKGLVEVEPSSALLVKGRPLEAPGSALTSTIEGTRALTVEIQSLVTTSCYGTPQRMTTGIDRNRASMLLAVCEKHLGIPLSDKDTFINVIGGVKLSDPALDLAIISSLLSSARGLPIKESTLILGEVGLSGELRPVSRISERISEAVKLGIKTIVLPSSCKNTSLKNLENKKISQKFNTSFKDYDKLLMPEYLYVDNLSEAVDVLFSVGNK